MDEEPSDLGRVPAGDEMGNPPEVDAGELFFRLLSSSRHQLFAFIFTMIPNHTDAEDVFQETSFVLWSKFPQYDRKRSFLPWACGVAFNVARNQLRAAGRDRLVFSDALLASIAMERPTVLVHDEERMEALSTCLKKLTKDDRRLVEQFYAGGSSVKEIAASMNRAVQTVYNRLTGIRRQLATCVQLTLSRTSIEGDLA